MEPLLPQLPRNFSSSIVLVCFNLQVLELLLRSLCNRWVIITFTQRGVTKTTIGLLLVLSLIRLSLLDESIIHSHVKFAAQRTLQIYILAFKLDLSDGSGAFDELDDRLESA